MDLFNCESNLCYPGFIPGIRKSEQEEEDELSPENLLNGNEKAVSAFILLSTDEQAENLSEAKRWLTLDDNATRKNVMSFLHLARCVLSKKFIEEDMEDKKIIIK